MLYFLRNNLCEVLAIGFQLLIILHTISVSYQIILPEANALQEASLIVIDEITVISKKKMKHTDKLLREIMGNDISVGRKVCVASADFRNVLPAVPR